MRLRASDRELQEPRADLRVCFAWEGDRAPRGVTDASLRRHLAAAMRAHAFRGRAGDRCVWVDPAGRRYLVAGLGAAGAATPRTELRAGCARALRAAASLGAARVALRLPWTGARADAAQARLAAEGALLGAYQFDRYLTDPARRTSRPRSIEISGGAGTARRLGPALRRGEIVARAVCQARDLVNEPPSRLTPVAFARAAARQARAAGLDCRVIGPPAIERMGLHALRAVARGSAEAPRVVHLTYRPGGRAGRGPRRRVLLVGKGVTFDSGGLNLKPTDSMLTMKCDMGGAAAVLAAMSALPALGCTVEVHGLLGLVENMIGGRAYKPGDILDTHAGKTVEVGNTDAEGRLVLSDLLSWGAAELAPTEIVDVATLTGACVVALGPAIAGLFARDAGLERSLLDAARGAGEYVWPLPLHADYLVLLQKGPADLHNVGGRWGGAITAALFLGEFVPRRIKWAHLDIAGPAFGETESPEAGPGATGAGVPTLLGWLGGP